MMSDVRSQRWIHDPYDDLIPFVLCLNVYCCFFLFLSGCQQVASPFGERAKVSGKVTLDDKPLDRARIVFKSKDLNSPVIAVGTISKGEFRIPSSAGPLIGSARVEIFSDELEMEEYEAALKTSRNKKVSPEVIKIPARYNTYSELSVEVEKDEIRNTYEFRLISK